MHLLQAGGLVAAAALIYFLSRLYNARRELWELQKRGLPMPAIHPILGHLPFLRGVMASLPKNASIQTVLTDIVSNYSNGVCYLDLWPFSRKLIIVASPLASAEVELLNLSKSRDINKEIDKMTGGGNLITMDGDIWKRWRGIFNPGFSAGYMLKLAPTIADEVKIFRDLLFDQEKKGGTFSLERMTLRLTLDIVACVVQDTRLKYQTHENPVAVTLRRQIEWTSFDIDPIAKFLSPRPLILWYNCLQMNRHMDSELDRLFKERTEKGANSNPNTSKSIASLLLDEFLKDNEKHEMTLSSESWKEWKQFMAPQLRTFLFAGHDTTSSTLLYCYYLLDANPEALQRLRAEHDEVFGVDPTKACELIHENPVLLNQLPYTLAVVKETLRLYAPSGALRIGRPGAEIVDEDGNRFPTENSQIMLLAQALHRNPKYWKYPDSFMPERWLVGPSDPLYPPKGAWRPFETGPRNCIGQTLALLEMRIVLVMTVREFLISPAYDQWDKEHPTRGIKSARGNRVYQVSMGGGGLHPPDGFPATVKLNQERRK